MHCLCRLSHYDFPKAVGLLTTKFAVHDGGAASRVLLQAHGSNSSSRLTGWPWPTRSSTSASHSCGFNAFNRQVSSSVYVAATRSPPQSAPANIQFFRPRAMPRRAFSAELLSISCRPSVVYPLQRDGRTRGFRRRGCRNIGQFQRSDALASELSGVSRS